ncbi:hypothetical protein KC678_01665 [Candidatus Dojkabacteria bacterium]|uniref:Uncharacterized protein n=1 Tax=Candidatus Dojkabacteria bacterium TaxID=2099670 RepID=A0A955I961_9BACT|nr:hypothetical protein [Candidatus Dojkabacteria bacterium]
MEENKEQKEETTLGKEIKKEDLANAEVKSEEPKEKTSKKKNNKQRVQNMLFAFIALCFCCVIFSILLGGVAVYQSITGEDLFNTNISTPTLFRKNSEENSDVQKNSEESSKSDKDSAIEFNNKIVDMQVSLIGHFQNLGATLATKDIDAVDKAYSDSLGASYITAQKIDTIEVVEGGEDLRVAAKNLFQFYLDVLSNDYSTIVEELRLTGEISEESINNLTTKISANEAKLDLQFQKAQQELADKYNFEIQ